MAIKTQIASDVIRDGLGIELLDKNQNVIAEIFRCDKDHTVKISIFDKSSLTNIELEEFILKAKKELQQFEDGKPLPSDFIFDNIE